MMVSSALALSAFGCSDDGDPPPVDGGIDDGGNGDGGTVPECTEAADCDDGNDCTADSCNDDGECEYEQRSDGSDCTDADGNSGTCEAGTCEIECTDASQCDDGSNCTADSCNPETNRCRHDPANEGEDCTHDGNPGTCEEGACVLECTPENEEEVCDDGDLCTADMCTDGQCRNPISGDTKIFLVDTLSIPSPAELGTDDVPGNNLDDRTDNDHCPTRPEECDGFDPPQAPMEFSHMGEDGIDNALGQLGDITTGLGINLNESLGEALGAGDIVVLAKVEGIDDYTNDDCVNLSLLLGFLPEGADNCDGDCDGVIDYFDTAPEDDAIADFDSGLLLDINGESFDPDSGDPLIGVQGATIEDGRVSAGPSTITLDIPVDEETDLSITVQDANVAFDISETALANGLITGSIDRQELEDAAVALVGEGLRETVGGLLQCIADLMPNADGECQFLSAGLEFTALEAEEGEVQTESQATECETSCE
ncbi:MAG: hypothetical protein ACODAU_06450 [Myxococcota bacterium]